MTSVVKGVRLTDGYRNRVWLDPLLNGRYPDEMADLMERFGGLPVRAGDMAAIGTPLDWLGINYYHDIILEPDDDVGGGDGRVDPHPGVVGVREAEPTGDRTDMDWPITPDGLRSLLVSVTRDYPNVPPMMITENGAAYDDPIDGDGVIDDERRIRYLDAHLAAVAAAIAEGADVRGYHVWSLLDNFEWAEGYRQRFGIVHVDFETQVRTPRRSASWYRDTIQAQRIDRQLEPIGSGERTAGSEPEPGPQRDRGDAQRPALVQAPLATHL